MSLVGSQNSFSLAPLDSSLMEGAEEVAVFPCLPRRRKASNAGVALRHPHAIFACVSFSHKSFASQNLCGSPQWGGAPKGRKESKNPNNS